MYIYILRQAYSYTRNKNSIAQIDVFQPRLPYAESSQTRNKIAQPITDMKLFSYTKHWLLNDSFRAK